MTLTAAQVTDVRRFCGYSVSGDSTSQPYREPVYSSATFMSSLTLDYRLSHLSTEEEAVVINKFLVPLNKREDDIQNASCNIGTDTAGPWKRNARELDERRGLFKQLRLDLCTFLGFNPGPNLADTNRVVRA